MKNHLARFGIRQRRSIARSPRTSIGLFASTLVLLLWLSAWAISDVDCLNPGPDLIIGDIFDAESYGSVGDRAAFSIGTDVCNIGDEPVNWIAETPDHPVFDRSLYRIHDNRVQQIGLTWLKHGFGAVQDDSCGCGCVPADWTHLGVGCSDAYSASWNGLQSIQGSRLEVDPWPAAFPFPPDGWGETGDAIFRRLNVHHDDLDPTVYPDAVYFAEAHVLSPHESGAGNRHNNFSTRAVSFAPAGESWVLLLEDQTLVGQPVLRAWAEIDPQVVVSEIHVPGDGRVLVAARVQNQGDGWYRYEYAVENLDYGGSIRSFRVPFSEAATIGGVTFSDIDYHSGDPIVGTDWLSQIDGSSITWSTDDWSTDPWANAIRWGTTYSFGFRANIDPVKGLIELDSFMPGMPSGMAIASVVPRTEQVDPCSLPPGPCPQDVDGDLLVTTNDLLLVLAHWAECGDGTWQPIGDIDHDCCVTVDDLIMLIGGWGEDCRPVGACCLSQAGCQDELSEKDCLALGGKWQGDKSQCATANCPEVGACCLVDGSCIEDVSDSCEDLGGLFLSGGQSCDNCPLMTDACTDASEVVEGMVAFDTRLATTDGPIDPECAHFDEGEIGNDIWAIYSPAANGTLVLSTCGTADYDTDIAIYDGIDCEEPVLLGCNDDFESCPEYSSYLEVPVLWSNNYLLRIGGWVEGNVGTGTLLIELIEGE